MARLNEVPAPAESVEALKRRFVRQNREIARVNSTQSLRIRNLESEISRLLSENIALREQVIKLQYDIENTARIESVSSVKQNLEAKLAELGSLVQELGKVQLSAEERRAARRRSEARTSPRKSPDQKDWKNTLTISEVMGGSDGRLPPIVEDKYYPRRTLDTEEMLDMLSYPTNAVDSPDLGPPPVAHLDEGDPIKYDAYKKLSAEEEHIEAARDLNPALLANLQTRRKRKDKPKELTELLRGEPPFKSGAKRKFVTRDNDDESGEKFHGEKGGSSYDKTQAPTELGAIRPLKKDVSKIEKSTEQSIPQISRPIKQKEQERAKGLPAVATAGRSVLGPKSVNLDPLLSPVKPRKPIQNEKPENLKQNNVRGAKERNRSKDQQPSQRFARQMKEQDNKNMEPYATIDKAHPPEKQPPETPAPPNLDILSPNNSPSANRLDSRDTPPPVDLSRDLTNTEVFGSLGRASRRQRGSVSYAEPNLRHKMRRPTKELVDAVAADERIREQKTENGKTVTNDADPVIIGMASSKMRTVVVKKESNVEDDVPWKKLPPTNVSSDKEKVKSEAASPLRNGSSTADADLPESVVTERRRRASMLERSKQSEVEQHGSGAGSAISALMTENPKSKARRAIMANHQLREEVKPIEKFDVFELDDSSPHGPENVIKDSEIVQTSPRAKALRRHSSMPGDRMKDAMARRTERRQDETSGSEGRERRTEKESRVTSVPELKQGRSSAAISAPSGDALPGRGERGASRRRSMML